MLRRSELLRIAVMQPYLFPYVGYFQLMHAVDKFVAYDDVAYIRQGWINRNNILVNAEKSLVTVPVASRSSFVPINKTLVSDNPPRWQNKLLTTIHQAYARAPYFEHAFPLVESTLATAAGRPISEVAIDAIERVRQYLGLSAPELSRSSCYGNQELAGAVRVLDICERERATVYINMAGGRALYDKTAFASRGVVLRFLTAGFPEYKQFCGAFVPGLSIIDVLMFNPPEVIRTFLDAYAID